MNSLLCPFTQNYIRDPVITPCGHTFERQEILNFLEHTPYCPIDAVPLAPSQLKFNFNHMLATYDLLLCQAQYYPKETSRKIYLCVMDENGFFMGKKIVVDFLTRVKHLGWIAKDLNLEYKSAKVKISDRNSYLSEDSRICDIASDIFFIKRVEGYDFSYFEHYANLGSGETPVISLLQSQIT